MSVSDEKEALLWLQRSRDSKSPSLAKVHATALLGLIARLERKRMRALKENADLRDHIAAQQRHFG